MWCDGDNVIRGVDMVLYMIGSVCLFVTRCGYVGSPPTFTNVQCAGRPGDVPAIGGAGGWYAVPSTSASGSAAMMISAGSYIYGGRSTSHSGEDCEENH